jgi:nucleoside-diphosphate-sugar epimerase
MREKILLTGATGFLGSHLLESFISQGFEVSILKRSTSNTWRINHLLEKVRIYNIDEVGLDKIFIEIKPEIILHTACTYGRNSESLSQILDTNLIFGINLLEESIKNNVKTFINTDSLLPRNINDYSLSKAQFTDWLQKYSSQIQVINFKIEHMYGVKDDNKKFLPWLINEMINGRGEIKLTSGIQKRDFIYISDVVAAFDLVLQKRQTLTLWNVFDIGTNVFTEVRGLVMKVASILEKEHNKVIIPRLNFGTIPYREEDIMTPNLDNKKIIELGWHHQVNIDEGVKLITKEYK